MKIRHFEHYKLIEPDNKGYYVEVSMGVIQIKKWEQTLLPFPYSTNCFDYSINRRNNVWPKSQTDCKLEYMRRKELKECNHNYYWSQHLFDNNQQILDFNQTFQNCSVKVNQTYLDMICQRDCDETEFFVSLIKDITYYPGCFILYLQTADKFIHSTYSEKMDLIAYFSTFGGLISMYLGFGVSNLCEILMDTILLLFSKFFNWFKIKRTLSNQDHYKRVTKNIKIFLHLLIFGVMLYQLIETTRDYILDNEKTEIRFRTEYRYPLIYLQFQPLYYKDRIKKIHPEQYNIIKHKGYLSRTFKRYVFNTIRRNVSEFKYISRFDEFSIKSVIKFEKHHLDCSSSSSELFYSDHDGAIIWMIRFLDDMHLISNSKTSMLSIDISGKFDMIKGSILLISSTNTQVQFYANEVNNLVVDSTFIKSLSNNGKNCKDTKQGLFTDIQQEVDLVMDCDNQELNKTFGCLPLYKSANIFHLKRDLNYFEYTICPINTSFIDSFENLETRNKYCRSKKKFRCETQIFSVYNNHRISDKPLSTQINIIPKNNFIPEYKQIYKMDFNDWVYNCGGIIGLWFGWSAMSVTGVVLFIKNDFTLYYRHFKAYIIMKLVHILNKIIIIMQYFYSFGKYLIKLNVWLALSLMEVIIFVGNSFVKLYKLIVQYFHRIVNVIIN